MSTAIPGFGQEKPTEESAIQSLSEACGSKSTASAAWTTATSDAGVAPPVSELDTLEKVIEQLLNSANTLVRVGGRSLKVRLVTYKALSRRNVA